MLANQEAENADDLNKFVTSLQLTYELSYDVSQHFIFISRNFTSHPGIPLLPPSLRPSLARSSRLIPLTLIQYYKRFNYVYFVFPLIVINTVRFWPLVLAVAVFVKSSKKSNY